MQPNIKKLDTSKEYYFDEGCYITELSNSDEDPELSIAKARVVPGITTKLHYLINTIERYVILEGEGTVVLDKLEPKKVIAYDVVIIPSGLTMNFPDTSGLRHTNIFNTSPAPIRYLYELISFLLC